MTPSRAGVPEECDEDREEEEEEEDPSLLGAHGPARRCCAGAVTLTGGYALECAAGDAPPEVAPLAVLPAAEHRRAVGGR